MFDVRKQFGNEGERFAKEYLQKNGYVILHEQWKCHFGEIDLVCKQNGEYVFVEVKSRHDDTYGFPEDAVTDSKRQHLAVCADAYLSEHCTEDVSWRVDVIAIEFQMSPPNIVHIEAIDR